LRKQGKFAEAQARYEEVLELSTKTFGPEDRKTLDARVNLANDLDDEGKYSDARDLYETAVALAEKELGASHPKTLGIRMGLANTLESAGDYEAAIQEYLRLTELAPGSPLGFNGAAWLYATCPRAGLRNGTKAAGLATRACGMSGWSDWRFIDTLAAAEAESGKFDSAMQHSRQALDLATTGKADAATLSELRAHLAFFQKGQPYHQTAAGQ
jgi:tetratricopeptide (TPR) repeat protein